MHELKARLVDGLLVQDGSLCQAHGLFGAFRVVHPAGQRESADAHNVGRMGKFITCYQRILRIDLIVDARAKFNSAVGCGNSLAERNNVQGRIKNRGVNYRIIVDVALFEIKKERSLVFGNWPAKVAAVLARRIRRARGRKRVARVEGHVVKAERSLAAKLVRAWLGQDFDSSKSWPVVLGRKWIRINSDFTNRCQRRKIPAREAIDENLTAIGPG